jgi:hypothetical protein
MADPRVGKVQDESEHFAPESKKALKKMKRTCQKDKKGSHCPTQGQFDCQNK